MASDFLEKTLEEMVFQNQEEAVRRGFPPFYKNTRNQFKLPSGKIIDIFSFEIIDNSLRCKIFELKKDDINLQSAYQAIGYAKEICKLTGTSYESKDIQIYLVGSDIEYNFLDLVGWGINISPVVYNYKIDGLSFELMSSANVCWFKDSPTEFGVDEINGPAFRGSLILESVIKSY